MVPFLSAHALGSIENSAAKDGLLCQSIACRPLDGPALAGAWFVEQRLAQVLRSAGMRQLARHQRRGHDCAAVSASLDIYLDPAPWPREVGLSDIVCSRLELDDQGRTSGGLEEGNCHGRPKLFAAWRRYWYRCNPLWAMPTTTDVATTKHWRALTTPNIVTFPPRKPRRCAH